MFRDGQQVLVRAKLALSDGVAMQLTVRAEDSMVDWWWLDFVLF